METSTVSSVLDPEVSSTTQNLGAPATTPSLNMTRSGSKNTSKVRRKEQRSQINSNKQLRDDETGEDYTYGSDIDYEGLTDEEEGIPPLLIPRSVRAFLEGDLNKPRKASANLNIAGSPTSSNSPSTAQQLSDLSPTVPPVDRPIIQLDKFAFEWRAFSQSLMEPTLRREPFSAKDCGPTAEYDTAYHAFIAIWDKEIMEHIAEETNRYAQQQLTSNMMQLNNVQPCSRIRNWRDTTVDELYVYFAILQAMAIVVKNRIEEYWNDTQDIFSTPEFHTAMRLDCFLLIKKCLHFQNNETCNSSSMTCAQAKVFKLQPLLDHLNNKFSSLYNLNQNLALDESLTMWKGWLSMNQLNKAMKCGIRSYEVCETKTGYLWRFEVHAPQESSSAQDESPVSGLVPSLVLRLLNGLEQKGHTIWMDSYYNSPALARELKCRGFDCVGTLRTNRQFVPNELRDLNKTYMDVDQGIGYTSGDVYLMVWRDRNCVAHISTYHGMETIECGDTRKLTVIYDYNRCMGCVDRKDQMLAMYPIERKGKSVWYKKFFRRLLNVSVLNAYILYNVQHRTVDHRNFRKTLVNQLLTRHTVLQPMLRRTINPINTSEDFEHYPQQYDRMSHKIWRICAECRMEVSTYCKGCNKALCLFTCFGPYHTKLLKKSASQ